LGPVCGGGGRRYSEVISVRTTTALLIALTVAGSLCAAFADNGPDERSPFGIVCPWTDIGQTGARWTRCGAGATELVN